MRILHILSQHPDQTGSGIYLQELVKMASCQGFENYILAGSNGKKEFPWLEAYPHKLVTIAPPATTILLPGMSDTMPYATTVFSTLSHSQWHEYQRTFQYAIAEAIEEFSPTIIHSHHLWQVTALTAEIAKVPVVCSCHGSDLRQFLSLLEKQAALRQAMQKIAHVFALSEAQKKMIEKLYQVAGEKISVVGAGVDRKNFNPSKKRDSKTQQLLFAGKLSHAKGLPYLLQALLARKEHNFTIHLAGSGTGKESRECIELCKQLGKKAVYHGQLSRKELATLMQQSDLFILPSLWEGVPLVVLEALACGCMVLASELPGVTEIQQKSRAALYTLPLPKGANSHRLTAEEAEIFIAELDKKLTELEDKKLKNNNEIDYFSWDAVFSRIHAIYSKLL